MARLSLPRRGVLLAIRAYQLTASSVLGRRCRFLPTCSDYAAEAVGRHGVWPGAWMATARLCRCHPFGAWGYDPVPLTCAAVPATRPWRYGVWRMPAAAAEDHDRASSSAARP